MLTALIIITIIAGDGRDGPQPAVSKCTKILCQRSVAASSSSFRILSQWRA
jgi:hypothetical protein